MSLSGYICVYRHKHIYVIMYIYVIIDSHELYINTQQCTLFLVTKFCLEMLGYISPFFINMIKYLR